MRVVLICILILGAFCDLNASKTPDAVAMEQENSLQNRGGQSLAGGSLGTHVNPSSSNKSYQEEIALEAKRRLKKKLGNITAEIAEIPSGPLKDFWNKVVKAHDAGDLATLERLQYGEKGLGTPVQIPVLFFIISASYKVPPQGVTHDPPALIQLRRSVEHIPGICIVTRNEDETVSSIKTYTEE